MLGLKKSNNDVNYIDVVKFTPAPNADWVMYRYPGTNFCNTSKLIVGPGQRAICVHGGKVEGEFSSGTTQLSTETYPFLQRLVAKIHGNRIPYTMEIYFLNSTVQNRVKWGTKIPAQLEDPKSGLLVHMRSYGSYNFRLGDFQFFLSQFSGAMMSNGVIHWAVVTEKLGGVIQQTLQKTLGVFLVKQNLGALQLSAYVEEFSKALFEAAVPYFATYGFELIDLFTESINFPDEDMAALKKRRELDTLGTSHIAERQLDIQEKWAGNEGQAGGMAAAGMGLGLGFAGMNAMMQGYPGVVHNGMMPNGMMQQQNQNYQQQNTAPNTSQKHCTECGTIIPEGAKFCSGCGKVLARACPKCGQTVSSDAKFCANCGTKID